MATVCDKWIFGNVGKTLRVNKHWISRRIIRHRAEVCGLNRSGWRFERRAGE
jgi:hypothetical protein